MAQRVEVTSDGWIVDDGLRLFRILTEYAPPRPWGYWDQIRVDAHAPACLMVWAFGGGLTVAGVGLIAAAAVTGQWLLLLGCPRLLIGPPRVLLHMARGMRWTIRSIRAHPVATGVIDALEPHPDPAVGLVLAVGRAALPSGELVNVQATLPLARAIQRAGTPAEVQFIDNSAGEDHRPIFAARPVQPRPGGSAAAESASATDGTVRGTLGVRTARNFVLHLAVAALCVLAGYGLKNIIPSQKSTNPQQAAGTLSYGTQPAPQGAPVVRDRIALEHTMEYEYGRPVILSPTIVRLLPQDRTTAAITEGELTVMTDGTSVVHRDRDAEDNLVAAIQFNGETKSLTVRNRLTIEVPNPNLPSALRPLPRASAFPIQYLPEESKQLASYLEPATNLGPRFGQFTQGLPPAHASSVEWLAGVNKRILNQAKQFTRLEEDVLNPEDTLDHGGSCGDFAWLLVQVLRQKGVPARFVLGYQVPAEVLALRDQQVQPAELHAWVEAYLPGAGWVGLDPTTGGWTTAAYIPLAAAASPADTGVLDGTFAVAKPQRGVRAESKLRFKITVQYLGTVKP